MPNMYEAGSPGTTSINTNTTRLATRSVPIKEPTRLKMYLNMSAVNEVKVWTS
jgi:hypothetical protein